MAPLRLRHLHLPSIHPHYVPYSLANRVQEYLRRQHLDFKDALSASSSASTSSPPPSRPPRRPPPTLISFTPAPIFTLGRRQTSPLTPAEAARLAAPLLIAPLSLLSPLPSTPSAPSVQLTSPRRGNENQTIHLQDHHNHHQHDVASTSSSSTGAISTTPRLLHSPRGGLTTYHGPGQVVLWPILDLHPLHGEHRTFSVKCYARLLEETTIGTLREGFGIEAFTTEDPGVWVRRLQRPQQQDERNREAGEGDLSKIAALGVHLRRHITALGTALNVAMPGPEEVNEQTNPWARFVACGLAGRGVTSIAGELAARGGPSVDQLLLRLRQGAAGQQGKGTREAEVAGVWAGELARRIGLEEGDEGVEVVGKGEVVRLMEGLLADAVREEDELQEERRYLERIKEVILV